jgi:hypothetical protein
MRRSRAPVRDPALSVLMAEPGLSLASKGLAVYLLTRPPRVVRYSELFSTSSDPMVLVRAAAAELVKAGLVEPVPGRGRGNRDDGGIILRQPVASVS